MSIDPNDEILQDFLVEAGELLENLNEQLVDLEHRPDDVDLLNAVFRNFHTIKGGAGFLNLEPLVVVCHRAEDVFNRLRNRELTVNPSLMDVVLRVLDVVNVMFGELRAGRMPSPAPQDLLDGLQRYVTMDAEPPAAHSHAVPGSGGMGPAGSDAARAGPDRLEPAETAMRALFGDAREGGGLGDAPGAVPDAAQGAAAGPPKAPDASSDDITDEEFEALLDALHGAGGAPGIAPTQGPKDAAASGDDAAGGRTTAGSAGDEITDDEFEALLDQLHGKGRSPTSRPSKSPPESPREPSVAHNRSEPPGPASAPAGADAPGAPPSEPGDAATPASSARAVAGRSAPSVPAVESSVRVDTVRLDQIMNLVGELVLVRNRMLMLKGAQGDDDFAKAVNALALVTSDLQSAVMKTRMQPIKKVFGRFPRVVRDLARALGKQIDLEVRGEDTDLDKNLVEALADPLVHLVRNAVDHGIEDPATRRAAGKPETGHVLLSAEQEGDHISLVISDDGRGMDPDVLRAKAVEKGLMDAAMAERLTDREAFNLIFQAGFSTKTEISDVSGRGVGMDVVKTKIAQLNGRIEIESAVGVGTTLRIKLPLTLAILPALMVVIAGRRYALPLASVAEILDLDLRRTNFVDDTEVVVVRGHALPVYDLQRWVRPDCVPERSPFAHVVVVQVAERRAGLVVDELIGQEEVVIKPLGAGVQKVPGLAGATITGDGGIALILDVSGVLNILSQRPPLARRGRDRSVDAQRRAEAVADGR